MHYLFFEALARFHPCFMTLGRLCPNFFGFAFMGHVFAAGQAMVIQSKVGYYCLLWWSRRILEVLDNILFLRNPQQVLTIVIFSTRKGLTSFFFFPVYHFTQIQEDLRNLVSGWAEGFGCLFIRWLGHHQEAGRRKVCPGFSLPARQLGQIAMLLWSHLFAVCGSGITMHPPFNWQRAPFHTSASVACLHFCRHSILTSK